MENHEAPIDTWSPEATIGHTFVFRNTPEMEPGSRVAKIKITELSEKLGFGHFSEWVAEVKAVVVNDEGEISPEHVFVLKKFDWPYDYPIDSVPPAIQAKQNYDAMKKAGLKTWDTYRISQDDEMIIMTSGNIENKTIISTANDNATELGSNLIKNGIHEIPNFKAFLGEITAEVTKATQAGIYIPTDTYGFIVENEVVETNISHIDFVFADLDNIRTDKIADLESENLRQLKFTIQAFINLYVSAESIHLYQDMLNDHIK